MSVSSIINSATGKIFANLIPAGGGTDFTQEGQLIYGGQAPDFADQLLNIGNAGQVLSVAGGVPSWQDAGGSGLITANLPLIEEADPAPNSKISINFSANVGEIPYGTGQAKVGALTNAPQAGQVLGIAGGVPAWINAGGSGTVTGTYPIVESAGGNNQSVISIGYTQNVKGEIPAGSGTANQGVFLPPARDPSGDLVDGYVLQSLATSPSGMVWSPPTGGSGSQLIYRSQTASTSVLNPTSTQDTLILVAEEPAGKWNLVANPSDLTTTPYSMEGMFGPYQYQIALPDPHTVYFIFEVVYINNKRCVQLSARVFYPPAPYQFVFGHFHTDGYGGDAYIYTFLPPSNSGTSANKFQLSPVVGGVFDYFHVQGDGTEIRVANIAVLNTGGDFETVAVQPLFDTALSPDIKGLVNTDPAGGYAGAVTKLIYNGNNILIGGLFNAYLDGGDLANPTLGWYSIAIFDTTGGLFDNGHYLPPATTVGLGYGVQISTNQAYPLNSAGLVQDAYWVAQKLYIVGNWNALTIDTTSFFSAPAGMTGFAVADFALAGNKWVNTPSSATPIPQAICVRPSVSQAGSLIIALSGPTNPPQFFNTTTNAFTVATGPIPGNQNTVRYNSIVGGNIDIGFGSNLYDFVFYQDTVSLETECIYFINASGTVAQPLSPDPTNVAPDYQPLPAPGTVTSYGIVIGGLPQGGAGLLISGKDGLYLYDPTTAGANLVFSGTFFKGGVQYSNANFSTTGLVLGGKSQSYVAVKGLNGWIQIGQETTGLTYS